MSLKKKENTNKIDYNELGRKLLAHIINIFAILSVKLEGDSDICNFINNIEKHKEPKLLYTKINDILIEIKKDENDELKDLFAYSIKSNILNNYNFENDENFYKFIEKFIKNIQIQN